MGCKRKYHTIYLSHTTFDPSLIYKYKYNIFIILKAEANEAGKETNFLRSNLVLQPETKFPNAKSVNVTDSTI